MLWPLTYITSVYERAIKIGGIHRIVKDNKHTTASILQNISDVFRVETMNNYHSDGEIVLYDGRFNTLITNQLLNQLSYSGRTHKRDSMAIPEGILG